MGINTDEDGFVLDPEDWNEDFASSTAEQYEIELNEDHWRVIHLIRQLYSESGVVPELRIILRNLREQIGKDNATRKYVYALFPYGYGQQGCKIAGMRKPLKLWLDV
jgi:TusE/DsrC/DsvC family sulfur relay protein|tara:strand:+ start:319 stop:639 length:321 start_codon:yes stop_codon:yes gene_type:complete